MRAEEHVDALPLVRVRVRVGVGSGERRRACFAAADAAASRRRRAYAADAARRRARFFLAASDVAVPAGPGTVRSARRRLRRPPWRAPRSRRTAPRARPPSRGTSRRARPRRSRPRAPPSARPSASTARRRAARAGRPTRTAPRRAVQAVDACERSVAALGDCRRSSAGARGRARSASAARSPRRTKRRRLRRGRGAKAQVDLGEGGAVVHALERRLREHPLEFDKAAPPVAVDVAASTIFLAWKTGALHATMSVSAPCGSWTSIKPPSSASNLSTSASTSIRHQPERRPSFSTARRLARSSRVSRRRLRAACVRRSPSARDALAPRLKPRFVHRPQRLDERVAQRPFTRRPALVRLDQAEGATTGARAPRTGRSASPSRRFESASVRAEQDGARRARSWVAPPPRRLPATRTPGWTRASARRSRRRSKKRRTRLRVSLQKMPSDATRRGSARRRGVHDLLRLHLVRDPAARVDAAPSLRSCPRSAATAAR